MDTTISVRIRKARKERGLTQEQLASPHFTKGYVSALERGAVRPSLKALEHFASRLDLPLSHFVMGLESGEGPDREGALLTPPGVEALQEDLNYQYNYARMMIRSADAASIEEALALINAAEQTAAPYRAKLPPGLLHRPYFLRGMAYMRRSELERALPELERALAEAATDEQADATVRNMLGVAYYLLQQPATALHHHLRCLYAIEADSVKDLSLRLSILHNLANDYWALHDIPNAINAYKRALPLVKDLDGLDRQANTLWALGMAYRAANDWPRAKLYATRALSIFQALEDMSNAASVCIHLAELFTKDSRFADAQEMLAQAEQMVEKANHSLLLSSVHTAYADLHRKMGDRDTAVRHVRKSISLIRSIIGRTASSEDSGSSDGNDSGASFPPINVMRAHVEALQIAALLEDEQGNTEEADRLFNQALALLEQTGLVELAHAVAFSYAEVLGNRGDYFRAAQLYRLAAQSVPGATRSR